MLPEDLIVNLNAQFPCRELQIRQLSSLFTVQILPNPPVYASANDCQSHLPSPPIAIVHGLEATGKTSVVRGVLSTNQIHHCVINSRECVTGRHLLERTTSSCLDALEAYDDIIINRRPYARCETINALAVHLQRMLEGRQKFVLVFDGIDRQRETLPTLLPALARFGEIISNLSILLITTLPRPQLFRRPGLPYLHFPTYTRNEIICILSAHPPDIFLTPPDPVKYPEYTPDLVAEDNEWVWTRFLAAVWDSLGKYAASDLVSFKNVSTRLWRPFVAPIVDGTFGTRDFSRLMVHRRALFQGENTLTERIVSRILPTRVKSATKKIESSFMAKQNQSLKEHELPYYSKYLLCAAYLASYNPARTDSLYFMKINDKRRKRRKGAVSNRVNSKNSRRIPRHLLSPSPFPLDRLLAVFKAILDGPVPQAADLYTQIATLTSIRLLVRAGIGGADVLDTGCKWKVNFGWEWIQSVGRGVGLEMSEFTAGGME